MHVHREAGESPLQVDFSLQKDDQLYSIIIINTTILIILMAMHGEHHCSDGLLDHSSAAPLPTRPGWRMFSSTSQGSSPQPTKHKKFNLPQGSFCPESLAASHHRWRSVLASTPITLTIQVLRAFQFSAIFTTLQECLASLSLASADERHGVATVARLGPLLLLPRPRHQCRRLQELSS